MSFVSLDVPKPTRYFWMTSVWFFLLGGSWTSLLGLCWGIITLDFPFGFLYVVHVITSEHSLKHRSHIFTFIGHLVSHPDPIIVPPIQTIYVLISVHTFLSSLVHSDYLSTYLYSCKCKHSLLLLHKIAQIPTIVNNVIWEKEYITIIWSLQ